MSQHEAVREQVIQWILGEPVNVPISSIIHHLSECAECNEYAKEMEETLGHLPAALPLQQPPSELRHNILHAIRQEESARVALALVSVEGETSEGREVRGTRNTKHTPSNQESQDGRLRQAVHRWGYVMRRPVIATLLFALVASNVGLVWSAANKDAQLANIEAAYTTDLRWLKTAESLLIQEKEPVARTQLLAMADAPSASGQAVVYAAYNQTHYLLLQVAGLEPEAPYEIWLQAGEERTLLGNVVTSAAGEETWVYRSQSGMPTGRLGVRREGAAGPAMVADLPEMND